MEKYILIYFAVISLITVIVTIYDKKAARRHKRRVPEKALITLAFLGGSVAELFTMLKIRHKTKHKRFMIGLPAIIILQAVLIGFALYKYFM